jgi:hypothetical protein
MVFGMDFTNTQMEQHSWKCFRENTNLQCENGWNKCLYEYDEDQEGQRSTQNTAKLLEDELKAFYDMIMQQMEAFNAECKERGIWDASHVQNWIMIVWLYETNCTSKTYNLRPCPVLFSS